MPQPSLILPLLVLIPLLCALGIMLLPKGKDSVVKGYALLTTLVAFAASLYMCYRFNWANAGATQFGYLADWFSAFGVRFSFGVDSISLWLVMLTTFLMPITVLGSFSAATTRVKEFYIWLLILQAAMTGVFVAQDIILFYCCFELTLVPLYFLIGIYGSGNRQWASKKFFIFTLTGSLLTFAGVMWVAWCYAKATGGNWNFDISTFTAYAASDMFGHQRQVWLLLALMAGFAVKVPLFPVHTWLPLAHTEAPTSGSVLLAGVLLKLGTYGLLRFVIPMAPSAVVTYAPVIAIFAIIGILYTALICWVQDDIKKLVAYSSVSHLGFCVLGMFALNTIGVGGSIMYMINHGLSTGALFLCIGMIYERYHTRDMNELSGLGKRLPVWSTFMVFFCLASVGLPGLNGFVGEFLTMLGAFTSGVLGWQYTAVAALGLIFGAIYILYMLGRVVMGPIKEPEHYAGKVQDLSAREIAVLVPLAIGCIVLGVYPTPVLRSLEPAIENVTAGTSLVINAPSPRPYDFSHTAEARPTAVSPLTDATEVAH